MGVRLGGQEHMFARLGLVFLVADDVGDMLNSDDSHGSRPDPSWDRDILAKLAVVAFLLLAVLFALYLTRSWIYTTPSCGFGCPVSSVSRALG